MTVGEKLSDFSEVTWLTGGGLGGDSPRQAALESGLLIMAPLYKTDEGFLENIFETGADQEMWQ